MGFQSIFAWKALPEAAFVKKAVIDAHRSKHESIPSGWLHRIFWQNHLRAIASLFFTKTYYALAAEVAASSLPALLPGRLVAFEVRVEPAKE